MYPVADSPIWFTLPYERDCGDGGGRSIKIVILSFAMAALLGTASQQKTTALPASSSSTEAMKTVAADFRPGQTFRDCPNCPELVVVPAGSFTMGSPTNEPDRFATESPQRRVTIRHFAVGKFDVTRGQWAAFVSATNRKTASGCAWAGPLGQELDPKLSWRKLGFPQDDTHPVVCVTWGDAQDYVRWLSQHTGHKYRLLSEAEWEYAARGGTSTRYPWRTTLTHENANYGADECCSGLASGRDRWVNTSPAGSFPPNAFGLHDMLGNVLQWVQDCQPMAPHTK